LCGNADLVLFVNKKINFISPTRGPGNNTLGSTLVAYGERGVQALLNTAAAGLGQCSSRGNRFRHPGSLPSVLRASRKGRRCVNAKPAASKIIQNQNRLWQRRTHRDIIPKKLPSG
jgi:hypothetical protein